MRHPCFKTAGSASDSDTSNACSIIPAAGRIQRIENTKFAQYLLYSTLFFAGPSENGVREQAEAMALVETGRQRGQAGSRSRGHVHVCFINC